METSNYLRHKPTVPLPLLVNSKPAARLELFARKLHFCCYCFDFSNESDINKTDIELKKIYLNECIEFMEDSRGILSGPIYAICSMMFASNVFRTLPPTDPGYDPDDDDPIIEPTWPHLQLVYVFFVRFLESPDFQPSEAKNHLDHTFIKRLLDMFATDDINERENLKTILHRIYGKFLGLRLYIRKVINLKFLEVIHEDLYYPGITEILEVLGSIINGYGVPLKPQHIQFLFQILLPLHSSPKLSIFQAQLVYCVVQYLEKDPSLTKEFITKYLKRWPKTDSGKEVMYLGELEEVIDVMQPTEFIKVQVPIFKQVAKSIQSEHFQVAERALFFWDNEYIVSLMEVSASHVFPIVLTGLLVVSNFHWNPTINTMATNVLRNFMTVDQKSFQKTLHVTKMAKKAENERRMKNVETWKRIEEIARENSDYELYTADISVT